MPQAREKENAELYRLANQAGRYRTLATLSWVPKTFLEISGGGLPSVNKIIKHNIHRKR
jgi:hypothetical protein